MSTADGPSLGQIKRTALIVGDLDRSKAFYIGLLGLSVWTEGVLDDPAGLKLLGLDAGHLRFCICKGQGPALGMVGLFEVTNPAPFALPKPQGGVRIGDACLVWELPDISRIYQALQDGGHSIICHPTALDVPESALAMAGIKGGLREMTFRDPDGIMINLIEKRDAAA